MPAGLVQIAESLLAAVVQHFASAGVALPADRFVAAGGPREAAWDCEQVTVACAGIGLGISPDTGPLAAVQTPQLLGQNLRHAVLAVQVVRCHPTGTDDDLPAASELHAAGLAHLRDAAELSQALHRFATDLDPAHGLVPPGTVQAGAVEPVGPDGGMVAVEGTLSITLGALS